MYTACKQYLIQKLKEAGIKTNPYTSQKKLEASQESHIGAVLFESEGILRNGSKTIFNDKTGAQKKRRKLFDRKLAFNVIIGDYTDEVVEAIFERFLVSCYPGLYIDGNYVSIAVEGADWVEKEDSILRAKVAVEIDVTFDGGIYKDTDFGKISEIEIESVSKGKEPVDGN